MQRFVERFRGKASKSGQVSARVKKMARLSALMAAVPAAEHPASLRFPRLPFLSSGKDVLKIDRLAVGYEFPLMQPLNLCLKRGQRLAIVGANGLGKSPLLKSLAGKQSD